MSPNSWPTKINQTENCKQWRSASRTSRFGWISPGIADVLGNDFIYVVHHHSAVAAAQAIAIGCNRLRIIATASYRYFLLPFVFLVGPVFIPFFIPFLNWSGCFLGVGCRCFIQYAFYPGHRRCRRLCHRKSHSRNHGPSAGGPLFSTVQLLEAVPPFLFINLSWPQFTLAPEDNPAPLLTTCFSGTRWWFLPRALFGGICWRPSPLP